MINVMNIQGHKAVIAYDPDIALFRGEFVDLNGSADFYATDVEGLKREGEISLKGFLEVCREQGLDPRKAFSVSLMYIFRRIYTPILLARQRRKAKA